MKQIFEACGEPIALIRMRVLKAVFKRGVKDGLANPLREVTQLFDFDGVLLAEHDPVCGCPGLERSEYEKWMALPDVKNGDGERLSRLYGVPIARGGYSKVPGDFILPSAISQMDVIVVGTDTSGGVEGANSNPVKAYYSVDGTLIAVCDSYFPGPRMGCALVAQRYRAMEVVLPEIEPDAAVEPQIRESSHE